MNNADLFITGDYYSGAYGPSVLLVLHDLSAVQWFASMLRSLDRRSIDLVEVSGVRITGLTSLRFEVRRSGFPIPVVLSEKGPLPELRVLADDDGRELLLGLLEPFLLGEPGHQYVGMNDDSDVIIEISFGESHG